MRWLVLVVMGVIAVVLETSQVVELLRLPRLGGIHPSFVGALVVFVALFAPRMAALWSAWILGLLLELASPEPYRLLIGPLALGYVFGTYFVLQIRTMVFRQRLVTIAVLTTLCLVASGVVEVTLLTVRSWFAGLEAASTFRGPGVEFARRLGIALYSGLLALPLGWLLLRTLSLWGFDHAGERRRSWR